jgi:uncharacterized membrane protein
MLANSRAMPQGLRWPLSARAALPLAVLAVAALGLRLYRLEANALWYDELYGYQLAQLGPAAIIANSGPDNHPPLYYLLAWAASGFGAGRAEWLWRWPSALSGAGTVLVTYAVARQYARQAGAFALAAVAAANPLMIYFSQESRSPAFATLLAALLLWLLHALSRSPERRALWITQLAIALAGLYTSYNFILVAGLQLAALALMLRRWRATLLLAGALGVLFGGAFVLLEWGRWFTTIGGSLYRAAATAGPLAISEALLGGESARYGVAPGQSALAAGLLVLFAAGSAALARAGRRAPPLLVYCLVQVLAPFVAFYGLVGPLTGQPLPLNEAKQFMVVLPAFYVLAAYGFERIWRLAPRPPVAALLIAAGLAALAIEAGGLARYWSVPKGSEGLAVRALRARLEPGDAVVSLNYATDAALSFYLPEVLPYTKPQLTRDGYRFSHSTVVLIGWVTPPSPDASLEFVGAHPRVWLLANPQRPHELAGTLRTACRVDGEEVFGPFTLTLLSDCRP